MFADFVKEKPTDRIEENSILQAIRQHDASISFDTKNKTLSFIISLGIITR